MANKTLCLLLAGVVLNLLTACGPDTTTRRAPAHMTIVGGREVAASDTFARSAVFFTDHEGNIGCSGVLIGQHQVLSAAHCFSDESPWADVHVAFAVSADAVKFSGAESNVRKVTRVYRHEGYNANFSDKRIPPFDLALVLFEGSIPAGHEPAPILPLEFDLQPGQAVTLAGYGKTGDSDGGNGVLRKVETFVGKVRTREKEVEFGPKQGHGACGGDSGGPAFVTVHGKNYLLATTSRGPTDSCSDGDAIYTDVRYFAQWVEIHSAAL